MTKLIPVADRSKKYFFINNLRSLIERKSDDTSKQALFSEIERQAKHLENPMNNNQLFLSKREINLTKTQFPDCRNIDDERLSQYISNLVWFSKQTKYLSEDARTKIREILQELCPGGTADGVRFEDNNEHTAQSFGGRKSRRQRGRKLTGRKLTGRKLTGRKLTVKSLRRR